MQGLNDTEKWSLTDLSPTLGVLSLYREYREPLPVTIHRRDAPVTGRAKFRTLQRTRMWEEGGGGGATMPTMQSLIEDFRD